MSKILYFTHDFSDTNRAYAQQHGLTMRNSAAWHESDFIEPCDAVCGDAPEAYTDKYPLHELPDADAQNAVPKTTEALRTALTAAGIEFAPNAKKAELQALYEGLSHDA